MHKNPMYLQFKETKSFGSCLHFLSSVGAFICYCFVLSEVMGQVVSVKSPVTPINGQDFRCWKKKTTQKMIHWAKTCGVFFGATALTTALLFDPLNTVCDGLHLLSLSLSQAAVTICNQRGHCLPTIMHWRQWTTFVQQSEQCAK